MMVKQKKIDDFKVPVTKQIGQSTQNENFIYVEEVGT